MFKPTHRLIKELPVRPFGNIVPVGTLFMRRIGPHGTYPAYEMENQIRLTINDEYVESIDSPPDPNCSILGPNAEQIRRLITDTITHAILSDSETFDDKFQAIPDMVKDIEELKRMVAERDIKIAQLRRTIKNLTDVL